MLDRLEDVKNEVLLWDAETLKQRQGYIIAYNDILDFFSKGNT